METFDFIKICENHKLNCMGGIRIVSDICDGKNNKFCRLMCDFSKATDFTLELAYVLRIQKYSKILKLIKIQCNLFKQLLMMTYYV